MRLSKAIINSSLVLLLALGLGGCATNNSASTHKASHEPASAKVTKPSSHKKATNNSNDQAAAKQESNNVVANNQAANSQTGANTTAAYASQTASQAATTAPATSQTATAMPSSQNVASQNPTQQVARPAQNTQPAVTNDEEQEIPAPFYYYWVWNDEQGRTHNVDWDLLDRINQNGQLTYADYYTEFPSHAVQYDTREFNLHYDGTDQWVINFDNQINANPNHGVVNRMN